MEEYKENPNLVTKGTLPIIKDLKILLEEITLFITKFDSNNLRRNIVTRTIYRDSYAKDIAAFNNRLNDSALHFSLDVDFNKHREEDLEVTLPTFLFDINLFIGFETIFYRFS